jgi:hypothetical protein
MRRIPLLLAGALLVAVFVPGVVAAKQPTGSLAVPVTGATDAGGTFAGTVGITRFVTQNGSLVALGTVTGAVTDAAGVTTAIAPQAVALPVAAAGTCDILHLTLGPLDLNLLGLVVHLDRIQLDITAQQAPGNLLGNLLCAVAHLLDGGPLGGLSALLNNILAILQSVGL